MAGKDADVSGEVIGTGPGNRQPSLGEILASARERRQLSAAEAAAQARVPTNYVKMLEANDYSPIADQLYLVPFLRKYASFLGLDADDVAMRFVQETQIAENYPIRIPEPEQASPVSRSGWITSVAVALIVLLALYLAGVGRHRTPDRDTSETPAPAKPIQ